MNIAIWHCYHYGQFDTYVMLAETEEFLEAKVREAIADGWYPDDQGPMPEDWDELMEQYRELYGSEYYFGDWNYTVIDAVLCDLVSDVEL